MSHMRLSIGKGWSTQCNLTTTSTSTSTIALLQPRQYGDDGHHDGGGDDDDDDDDDDDNYNEIEYNCSTAQLSPHFRRLHKKNDTYVTTTKSPSVA